MSGDSGGTPFTDKERAKLLKRIQLRVHGSISSIQSIYADGCKSDRHGLDKGTAFWFDLDGGENITTVFIWKNSIAVTGLQFRTSHDRLSRKYGSGSGAPSVLRYTQDGKAQAVVGFSGCFDGALICRLDVIWSEGVKPRYTTTTLPLGKDAHGGKSFDDSLLIKANLSTAAIKRIVIMHGCWIDSIKIDYGSGIGTVRGGSGGQRDEFTLEPEEIIKKIEGHFNSRITELTFVTNKRRWGPYGAASRAGEPFIWDSSVGAPPHLAPYMGLLYFTGVSGRYLDVLAPVFADYAPAYIRKPVRYEAVPTLESSSSVKPGAPLSTFTSHLMAPIITLYAGKEKIRFYTHQDTLCQLPFFRAALQGEFKEGLEKTIDMPEDDPSKVSALIEFLSKGSYTYAYNTNKTVLPQGPPDLIRDLTEGLFHLGVYTIAFKYDCQKLADYALQSFRAVLDHLDGIDALRLWKVAYAQGLRISDWKPNPSSDGNLAIWANLLFKNHLKEMETTVCECPELACDLLRLTTSTYGH